MRKKDDVALYEAAKEAFRKFVITLQKELGPMLNGWSSRSEEWYTSIDVLNPKEYEGDNGIYGTEPGVYLIFDEECRIWFPRTSAKYGVFLKAMYKLHQKNDKLMETSIPTVDIYFNGKETVEFKIYTYVQDRANEDEYSSAKTIAEELIEMLSGLEGFKQPEYYEGDDFGNTDPTVEHSNYYVGLKTSYNMWEVE